MIQERLILEAKKMLHLTRQSIKEIAFALNFSDEFYFSRFFKKFTQVSPQAYRDRTGISIVADENRRRLNAERENPQRGNPQSGLAIIFYPSTCQLVNPSTLYQHYQPHQLYQP